jgi:MoaA/NifB/PqqE/SkfB family radical SAM enzyme
VSTPGYRNNDHCADMKLRSNISESCGDFRPRMIIWQLTPDDSSLNGIEESLNQHECLKIIDSIARLAKPIIVLVGDSLIDRPDLYDIVGYGNALGLKMIVEVLPEQITESLLEQFKSFGARTFRLILNNHIVEDIETRYLISPEFKSLQYAIEILRAREYELHFSYLVTEPNLRKLAFNLDYAFRMNGQGLYCHLRFDRNVKEIVLFDDEIQSLDEFILKISDIKFLLPNDMYLSPQCLRYRPYPEGEISDFDFSDMKHPHWIHQCLAGKTFAFINDTGKVFACRGMCKECGNLREQNYDFKFIWKNSDIMQLLRENSRSCVQTRLLLKKKRGVTIQQIDLT